MRVKTLTYVLFIVIIASSLWSVVRSIYIVHTTGTLIVNTTDPTATLAVSTTNRQAKYIGRGTAQVRLNPGTYLVSATDSGTITTVTTHVTKQQTTSTTLNIADQLKKANEANQLLGKLPIYGPAQSYTIDYYIQYSNGQSYPVVTISSVSSTAAQQALSWMHYYGFNPSDFTIHYETVPADGSYNPNAYVGGNP